MERENSPASSAPQGETGPRRRFQPRFCLRPKLKCPQKNPTVFVPLLCKAAPQTLPKAFKALQYCHRLSQLLPPAETSQSLVQTQGCCEPWVTLKQPQHRRAGPGSPPPAARKGDLGCTYRSTRPRLLVFHLQTQDIRDKMFPGG